uniref:Cochlin n=1 Tax=Gouania willdenowi TaxID=441366 RepID=A0A8C5I022_GOUWI
NQLIPSLLFYLFVTCPPAGGGSPCGSVCYSVPYPITCETRGADLSEDGLLVGCPAGCLLRRTSVFGTNVYAAVSSVCGAAVHSGLLGTSGGTVRLKRLQGRHGYRGSSSHGVQSQSLSHWISSFSLKGGNSVCVCVCADCQADIAVVMDSSTNIGQRRFNLQKNFIAKLAAALKVGATGPHVGLIQASDSPKTEFLLTNFTHPKDLLFAIRQTTYLGGNANTGKALLHAAQSIFSSELGARRGHPRVLLALVDGWPSDDVERAATFARDSGINVFIVSVAKASPEELSMVPDRNFSRKAVCKDNGFFSYSIPSWFNAAKHTRALSTRLCSLDQLLCSKTCYNSVHIGFLIDGSSSVGYVNFQLVLDFLVGIARSFDISDVGAHIGAVQFTYDQRLEFGMFDNDNKEDAIDALRRISYMSGGTSTGSAINYAVHNLFRPAARGRNFLIVVTDGQSYDDVRGPATAAHSQGVTIFSVGVAWAPLELLRVMSSEPKDTHTFFTRDFSGLSDFIQPVVHNICTDYSHNN